MKMVLALAALLGLELDVMVARLKRSAATSIAIAVLALCGFIFLLVAVYTALAAWIGPVWAALLLSALGFVTALLVYAGTRVRSAAKANVDLEKRRSTETAALATTAAITAAPLILKSPALRAIALPLGAVAAFAWLWKRRRDSDLPEP